MYLSFFLSAAELAWFEHFSGSIIF